MTNLLCPKVHKDANMLSLRLLKMDCEWLKILPSTVYSWGRWKHAAEIHDSTMETKAYMYVIQCADGTYTKYTTDIERRIKTHNAGKAPNIPVLDLWWPDSPGVFPRQRAAMPAEALLNGRARGKLTYIKHQ